MPHFIVSYAKPLEEEIQIKDLITAIGEAADKSELFTVPSTKVRALPVEHFSTGGGDGLFVHVDVKMFEGRTDEQKKHLNELVIEHMAGVVSKDVALSVMPSNIEIATYLKRE